MGRRARERREAAMEADRQVAQVDTGGFLMGATVGLLSWVALLFVTRESWIVALGPVADRGMETHRRVAP